MPAPSAFWKASTRPRTLRIATSASTIRPRATMYCMVVAELSTIPTIHTTHQALSSPRGPYGPAGELARQMSLAICLGNQRLTTGVNQAPAAQPLPYRC